MGEDTGHTMALERERLELLLLLKLKLLLKVTDMEDMEDMVDSEVDMEDIEDIPVLERGRLRLHLKLKLLLRLTDMEGMEDTSVDTEVVMEDLGDICGESKRINTLDGTISNSYVDLLLKCRTKINSSNPT